MRGRLVAFARRLVAFVNRHFGWCLLAGLAVNVVLIFAALALAAWAPR